MKKPQTAWAIKRPSGDLSIIGIRYTRKERIRSIQQSTDEPWRRLYKWGWRCVKVLITEK